jgi:hypothetical protein
MAISSVLGSSALLPAGLGFRNVLINGGFDVWQRGTSTAFTSTPSTSFLADRWSGYRNTTGSTQSRISAGLDGFQYALRMQRDSGNTSASIIYIGQSLETSTATKLANKPVVLSFYARAGANYSSASNALRVLLYSGTGTEANGVHVAFTSSTNVISTTATLTTSWQRFTYFATMPATSSQLTVQLDWTPSGTAGANDYADITGVQLEQNYQPTPFEQRPIGVELALCQRYYYRAVAGTQYGVMAMAAAQTTTSIVAVVPVPVSFRAVATSLETNNLLCTDGANNVTGTFALFRTTRNTISVSLACTGAVQFRPYFLVEGLDGTGYIAASAEL